MHTERLPCTVRLPSLLLIAQAIFLLERGHPDRHTESKTPLIHGWVTAGVDNYEK